MQNKKGFTLVELIVVITILSILGTIAFISFKGYSEESRDSKRVSDLSQIRTGLQLYQAKEGIVVVPDNNILVGSGANIYTYQGYAGSGVLNSIKVSDVKDPSDNSYYTYTTNGNRSKFQLLAMLESGNTISNNLITKTYADYTNRNAYPIGDSVGTLLEGITKTPVQQLETPTDIDLSGNTTEYIPVINRESSEIGAGLQIAKLLIKSNLPKIDLTSWSKQDSNCNFSDVAFDTNYDGEYDQIWAGCNSTLGNGIDWGQQNSGTIGNCFNYDGINNANDSDCAVGNSIMSSNSSAKKFFDLKQEAGSNSKGDSEFDTIWGKLYTWNNIDSACPSGWRVPKDQEWINLVNYLVGKKCLDSSLTGWQCGGTGIGWSGHSSLSKNDTNNLANALKIPLAGYRDSSVSTYRYRGNRTFLWSSNAGNSVDKAFASHIDWNSSSFYRNEFDIDIGFSVRCIKDI